MSLFWNSLIAVLWCESNKRERELLASMGWWLVETTVRLSSDCSHFGFCDCTNAKSGICQRSETRILRILSLLQLYSTLAPYFRLPEILNATTVNCNDREPLWLNGSREARTSSIDSFPTEGFKTTISKQLWQNGTFDQVFYPALTISNWVLLCVSRLQNNTTSVPK
jgi:hypothetical protein